MPARRLVNVAYWLLSERATTEESRGRLDALFGSRRASAPIDHDGGVEAPWWFDEDDDVADSSIGSWGKVK